MRWMAGSGFGRYKHNWVVIEIPFNISHLLPSTVRRFLEASFDFLLNISTNPLQFGGALLRSENKSECVIIIYFPSETI